MSNYLGYTKKEYKQFKRYSWLFLASFSFLCVCANCCRLNFSSAIPLMTENGWDTSQLGIITGAFFWIYAVGQVINGRISEIIGSKILLISAATITSLLNFIIGFQNSLIVIAVLWGINGLFQSMIWAPGISTLSNWWPGNKRGFATGFAHAFNGLGQGVCALAVSLAFVLLPDSGWKSAFWVPSAFPLIAAVIFALLAKQQPEDIGLNPYVEKNSLKAKKEQELIQIKEKHGNLYPYIYLLKIPSFVLWIFMAFFVGIARYGLLTWIPYYFVDRFGVSITSSLTNTFIIPLGMAVGTLVIPWLTDIFCSENRFPAVIISGIAATLMVPVFFLLEPGILAQTMLFFMGFFVYAINGLLWTFASDVGGRLFSGTASGMLNFASYLGAGCQSAVFGCILTRFNWISVFITITMCLLAIVVLAFSTSYIGKTNIREKQDVVS